jgi:hypothetical protein
MQPILRTSSQSLLTSSTPVATTDLASNLTTTSSPAMVSAAETPSLTGIPLTLSPLTFLPDTSLYVSASVCMRVWVCMCVYEQRERERESERERERRGREREGRDRGSEGERQRQTDRERKQKIMCACMYRTSTKIPLSSAVCVPAPAPFISHLHSPIQTLKCREEGWQLCCNSFLTLTTTPSSNKSWYCVCAQVALSMRARCTL